MATTSVKLTINQSALIRVVGPQVDRAAYRAAQRARGYAISGIISAGRVDTGRMMATLQVRRAPGYEALKPAYDVGSPLPYTAYQEFGTRAHGPTRAKFLVFTPRGASGPVFAKWVRGVPPGRFMRNAVAKVRASDFTT